MHGVVGCFELGQAWQLPERLSECEESIRPDQGNKLPSHEWNDVGSVLRDKMRVLANLLRASKHCVVYSGAGISRTAGIPDYASHPLLSAIKSKHKLHSNLEAHPTFAHFVVAELMRRGLVKEWVQQNHDGLPQKAGVPQHLVNEIHGAWFDPSNPVVQFSGNLRSDLFDRMLATEKKADLCLCVGTSLSGMNADRIATTPAKKFVRAVASPNGRSAVEHIMQGLPAPAKPTPLGTVLINLQMTPLDDSCTVRAWGTIDLALQMLAEELALGAFPTAALPAPAVDEFDVPYSPADGRLVDTGETMTWSLKKGAHVRVTCEDACNHGAPGVVMGRDGEGNWLVDLDEVKRTASGRPFTNRTVRRVLGRWWPEAAKAGQVPQLPIVNTNI